MKLMMKIRMSLKTEPFQKERIVFQPSIFRGYVSFQGGDDDDDDDDDDDEEEEEEEEYHDDEYHDDCHIADTDT